MFVYIAVYNETFIFCDVYKPKNRIKTLKYVEENKFNNPLYIFFVVKNNFPTTLFNVLIEKYNFSEKILASFNAFR